MEADVEELFDWLRDDPIPPQPSRSSFSGSPAREFSRELSRELSRDFSQEILQEGSNDDIVGVKRKDADGFVVPTYKITCTCPHIKSPTEPQVHAAGVDWYSMDDKWANPRPQMLSVYYVYYQTVGIIEFWLLTMPESKKFMLDQGHAHVLCFRVDYVQFAIIKMINTVALGGNLVNGFMYRGDECGFILATHKTIDSSQKVSRYSELEWSEQ